MSFQHPIRPNLLLRLLDQIGHNLKPGTYTAADLRNAFGMTGATWSRFAREFVYPQDAAGRHLLRKRGITIRQVDVQESRLGAPLVSSEFIKSAPSG